MKLRFRGGPGEFERRLGRADELRAPPGTQEPLALLRRILAHQVARTAAPTVTAAAALASGQAADREAAGRYPLLDLPAVAEEIADETLRLTSALTEADGDAVPGPLRESADGFAAVATSERRDLVATWIDDPSLLDPRLDLWITASAAPLLEQAAAAIELPPRHLWTGSACPACGGSAQVSVIAEESGEFMAGSPRSLVCSRCASWWSFPRATCVACRLDDSRQLFAYCSEDRPWARIDGCERCRTYIKTFDLRQETARDVIPLVDDLATLVLDVWATSRGLHRAVRSVAGV